MRYCYKCGACYIEDNCYICHSTIYTKEPNAQTLAYRDLTAVGKGLRIVLRASGEHMATGVVAFVFERRITHHAKIVYKYYGLTPPRSAFFPTKVDRIVLQSLVGSYLVIPETAFRGGGRLIASSARFC